VTRDRRWVLRLIFWFFNPSLLRIKKGVETNVKVDYEVINYEPEIFEQTNCLYYGRDPDEGQEVGKRVLAT
jgi:hypothetical protein